MKLSTAAAAIATLLSLILGNARATTPYILADLGTLGGVGGQAKLPGSYAYGINNSGQVVGGSYASGGAWHAFRTEPNQPINPATDDLGTLGGTTSCAYGINDSGQVAGYATNSAGYERAFRTGANQPINLPTDDLGTLSGFNQSIACGINASGQVVGNSFNVGSHHARGFRTAGGKAINPATDDLGTLGGTDCQAFGINDNGQVVGGSLTTAGVYNAFRTAANQKTNPTTDDLGAFNTSAFTQAYAVNVSGQAAGMIGDDAFRTEPNQPINPATDDLGNLAYSTIAFGVNSLGQTVGGAYTSNQQTYEHAFIYADGGPIQDLNSLIAPGTGWTLWEARGINDSGQIVGYGTVSSGAQRAFLLTPALSGDANLDGRVDINDLTKVLTYYGLSVNVGGITGWMAGDFNGDGKLDINDLTVVLTNYGRSLGSSAAAMVAVPETSAVFLLGIGAIAVATRARRRAGAAGHSRQTARAR
jgi:probable HAF family extracellular repeat protein